MSATAITFEEIMNELTKTGQISYACDSIHISRVLSHYVMDIPVYNVVTNLAPGDRQICQTLEEFDIWTMLDQRFLRCEDCGNFPREGYWKVVKLCEDDRKETNLCSLECVCQYLSRLKEEVADADKLRNSPISLIFSYETPKAYGLDSGSPWSEMTGKMWSLEIQCQECFAEWADRLEFKRNDMEPNKLTLYFRIAEESEVKKDEI